MKSTRRKPKHPFQPLVRDQDGAVRFKGNAMVKLLLDLGPFDMNKLLAMNFSDEDRIQFAQLIAYPLRGFGQLPYVNDKAWKAANDQDVHVSK